MARPALEYRAINLFYSIIQKCMEYTHERPGHSIVARSMPEGVEFIVRAEMHNDGQKAKAWERISGYDPERGVHVYRRMVAGTSDVHAGCALK